MTSGQVGTEWVDITKSAVAEAILNLTRLDEGHRDPQECLKDPVLWLALASLCVLDKDHVDGLSSGEWNNGGENYYLRVTRISSQFTQCYRMFNLRHLKRGNIFWKI